MITKGGGGWQGTRHLVYAKPFFYRITTGGALWKLPTNGKHQKLRTGLGSVKTFGVVGTFGKEDVFLATTRKGALLELRVRRDTRSVRTTTLRSAGYAGYSYVGAGGCKNAGRRIFAVTPKGRVDMFLDARGNDRSGRDITKKASTNGWTGSFFD